MKGKTICPDCHGMDDEMCDCDRCWGTGEVWYKKSGAFALTYEPNYTQIMRGEFELGPPVVLRELLNKLLPDHEKEI